ncbi:MAG: MFS transporter [Oscillospiraceae bacterium]|nr:MFS transporter [Oscillospiraceae bacterium]
MSKTLFRRDFLMVLIGQIISLFGNAALRLALPLYLLDQTGSPALYGLVSGVAFLPMILLSPVGGIIADRLPKAKIMACLDFVTAGLTIGTALLLDHAPLVPLIVGVLMLLYSIQGIYTPSVNASLPLLVQAEDLTQANAAVNLVNSLSALVGPVIGGVLYASFGLMPVLWVSAACFLVSAVMELFIRIPHVVQPVSGGIWTMVKSDLAESVRFLRYEKPVLAKVALVACSLNLLLSPLVNVGYPVLITQHLGLSSEWYGFAEGVSAAGGLLGGVLAGVLANRLKAKHLFWVLLFDAGIVFVVAVPLMLGLPVLAAYGTLTVGGMLVVVSNTLLNVVYLSAIQAITPERLIGKVISCIITLAMCAMPLGQSAYGVLFQWFEAAPWAVLLIGAAVTGLVALGSRPAFRQLSDLLS